MFISAKTFIIARSTFMWSLAYFLWTDPAVIIDNMYVNIVGQAMQLAPLKLENAEPLLGLVAYLLTMVGVSDVAPLNGPYLEYFYSIMPLRVITLFAIIAYCAYGNSIYLSNSMVFSIVFLDLLFSFFTYLALREERNEYLKKKILAVQATQKDQENM